VATGNFESTSSPLALAKAWVRMMLSGWFRKTSGSSMISSLVVL
jgi:hypothetical protein